MSSDLYGGEDSRGTGIETTAEADADADVETETDAETSMSIGELTAGERTQIGPRIPTDLLEAAGPWERGERRQCVEDAFVRRVFGEDGMEFEEYAEILRGELADSLAMLEPIREEFSNLPSLQQMLDEAERQRTHEIARAIHERRQEAQTTTELTAERESKLHEALAPLDEQVREHGRVFPGHGGVKNIASKFSMSPTRVIEELKERNPDVPDHAFECGLHHPHGWNGLEISKQAALPVDERPDKVHRLDQP